MYLKNSYSKKACSDTLNNVLKKYNSQSNKFELINIDTEGSEYFILKNIDFDKYKFNLILTGAQYTKKEKDQVLSLLKSKKYNYLKSISDTFIFVNANYQD